MFFDLDGTLVNSLYDLAASTNHVITKYGFKEREVDEFKYFVGDGIPKMLERAIGTNISGELFEQIKKEFKEDIAKKVNACLLKHGYLVGVVGDRILRIVPPLIITKEDVLEFTKTLKKILEEEI